MEIEIPQEALENSKLFKPADGKPGGGAGGAAQTPEEIEAARVAALTPEQKAEEERLAAGGAGAGGAGGEGGAAGGAGEETPPDPSLLADADPKLVENLEGLLVKEDGTLTEEEEKVLEDNLDLVKAIANRELPFVQQLMQDENILTEGDYEDTYEGRKQYLSDRDKIQKKITLDNFFAENKLMQDFKEHVVDNKLPAATFMAQVNRPAILDHQIQDVTDTMTDAEKNAITGTYEQIVNANLQSTGVDEITAKAIIDGAKSAGTLKGLAISSQANMKANYEKEIKAINEKSIAAQAAAKKAQDDEDAEITSLVKGGKLTESFIIPKADEVSFTQYMTTPVNDRGQTMADLKYAKLTLGERAALDYIVFKDMKLPSVQKTNVMNRFKTGNKSNQKRQVKPKASKGTGGFAGLNFTDLAREKGII